MVCKPNTKQLKEWLKGFLKNYKKDCIPVDVHSLLFGSDASRVASPSVKVSSSATPLVGDAGVSDLSESVDASDFAACLLFLCVWTHV